MRVNDIPNLGSRERQRTVSLLQANVSTGSNQPLIVEVYETPLQLTKRTIWKEDGTERVEQVISQIFGSAVPHEIRFNSDALSDIYLRLGRFLSEAFSYQTPGVSPSTFQRDLDRNLVSFAEHIAKTAKGLTGGKSPLIGTAQLWLPEPTFAPSVSGNVRKSTDLSGLRLLLTGAQVGLEGVRFVESDLSGSNLSDARLAKAVFSEVTLDNVSLRGADLRGAEIDGVQSADGLDCDYANARGALFHGNFAGASFNGAEADSSTDVKFDDASRVKMSNTTLSELIN